MRIPFAALLSGVLASLLFAGTAVADSAAQSGPVPSGNKALTDNPIYKTGKLDSRSCQEQPVLPDDLDSSRVYLEFVLECLNESWEAQFAKAKLPFSKPKFETTRRIGFPTGCGGFPEGAQAVYCPINKKITFLLDQGILRESGELFLFQVMAHEYGHHVQQLSGILPAFHRKHARTKSLKAVLPDLRKSELQAECLSGVFIGSVWRSLNRRPSDFTYVLRAAYDTASHGKARNIAYWLKRGFDQEGPGSCNTWTASASKVS
ncbi:neutral zinc metallopeptidase [Planobispora longispora]|uniref:Peptidase n=1 Tax=Planobispora longispora TaxID=28887 RepID=A0A8J3RMQ4_9ACTN|nr:neutral zinc metallopeptidase [Planobispora longispora]BFE81522.1 neutral zinc metallopeptidase [Planobispora longispora]GIH76617.1 peptidase [Planobispora longispora]